MTIHSNTSTQSIVLASTSPYRKELLQRILPHFTTDRPNTDETPLENETPIQLVKRLAFDKANSLAKHYSNHLIIGSDQVATLDNKEIIGKPHNFDNAFIQLKRSSEKKVTFHTGVCILNSKTGEKISWCSDYYVYFRALTETLITHYLNKEQPYNCAGSFKCEGLGVVLFDKMEGDDPTGLMGLPLIKTAQALEAFDFDLFGRA